MGNDRVVKWVGWETWGNKIMCKEGKEQDINRVGCIGQSSV